MSQKFQKRPENFICANCGLKVNGSGYTNHCPNCLWSKHVDVNPGDRASNCGGLMKPIGLIIKNSQKFIAHRCLICGYQKFNSVDVGDNMEMVIQLSTLPFKFKKG